jgi:UDP-2-acetamido-2-deoxy-ribo-hexuluronate aminotransferase
MEFIDLKKQSDRIKSTVRSRIDTVLEHGKFIMGPEVAELETRLGAYVGARHCISCASGTDALLLPLMAWGIGPGDAVLTSSFTFIATAEVIALLGATPIFVDIDRRTFNLDPEKLRQTIANVKKGLRPSPGTPAGLRLRGIIPVDLFGLAADYDAINRIAADNDLFVLQDAAQSFGGSYNGQKNGLNAEVAATSFFPAKPLGCFGDGGAIFTSNDNLAAIMRSIRVHGQGSDKYDNVRIGINGRLDTLQAAVLLAKLEIFDDEIRQRQIVAQRYSAGLGSVITTPYVPSGSVSAWAQYSVVTANRQAQIDKLKAAGVPSMIYYPKPLHRQKAFDYLGYTEGSLPVSEQTAQTIFSLPMHPYLTESEQNMVIEALTK